MKKRTLTAAILLAVIVSLLPQAAGAVYVRDMDAETADRSLRFEPSEPVTESASDGKEPVNIYIDGKKIDVLGRSYIKGKKVYVPVFEFALGMSDGVVSYDKQKQKMAIKCEGLDVSVTAGSSVFYANKKAFLTSSNISVSEDGEMMATLDFLCMMFGGEYAWNGVTDSYRITPTGEPLKNATSFISQDDFYWLSHIIEAEAGNEPFEGKIAVGNVIMNRVRSRNFPNSVYGVIFDRRSGIQFSPAYSGSIYKNPSRDSRLAAQMVLDGTVVTSEALYFQPTSRKDTCWAGRNRPYLMSIGTHAFWA